MGFQTQVNAQQAPAVAGDFASSNPRQAYPAPEGGFVAGTGGITVGTFVWIQSDGKTLLNSGSGVPDGFIHREQQALITAYLGESSMVIPAGFPVTVMRTGDYWANATVATAARGSKAFAKLTDGTVQFAAAGATVTGYIETAFVCTQAAANIGELAVMTQ